MLKRYPPEFRQRVNLTDAGRSIAESAPREGVESDLDPRLR